MKPERLVPKNPELGAMGIHIRRKGMASMASQ